MDEVIVIQQALVKVIRNFASNVITSPDDRWTIGLVQARLELLRSYWADFQGNHLMLLQSDIGDDDGYPGDVVYTEIEQTYIESQSKLYDIRERLTPATSGTPTPTGNENLPLQRIGSTNVRLPRMEVPTFSGQREDWEVFRDAFQALIHKDEQLGDVQKLFYLKSYVQGEAKLAVDSFPVTGANYTAVWDMLIARYEHPRLLAQDHINALRNLRPLRDENAKELQHLCDTLERHRKQLKALDRPVEYWDDWFISVATSSMDPLTRRAWEEELEKLKIDPVIKTPKMPTFDTLFEFLSRRCRTISSLESNRSNGAVVNRSFLPPGPSQTKPRGYRTLATQGNEKCGCCGRTHYTGHCDRFIALDFQGRRDIVSQSRLCFNCIRFGHAARTCPSRLSCSICGSLHHSILHEDARKREGAQLPNTIPSKRSKDGEHSAQAPISSGRGDIITARVLLDSCSEVTLTSTAFAHRANALLERFDMSISGVGGEFINRARLQTHLLLHLPGSTTPIIFEVYCLKHLGLSTPAVPISPTVRAQWANLILADEKFDIPGPVDLLIGANVLPELLRPGLIRQAGFIAQQTIVGWTISGRTSPSNWLPSANSCLVQLTETAPRWHLQLLGQLQRFWEIENLPIITRQAPDDHTSADELLAKFSDLYVLLRFLVRLCRWVRLRIKRPSTAPVLSPITAKEFNDAFYACVILSQRHHFAPELAKLQTKEGHLSRQSPLKGLHVFVDPMGIMRVGGRLQHSSLSYNARHPPILSSADHLAKLVITWAHHRALHGGFRSTYVHVVCRVWIVGGKRQIRAHIHRCVVCTRTQPRPMEQAIAPLPPERVTSVRAFTRTGLDYAGPFHLHAAKGRGSRTTKGYVAVFVCLASKGMHLEAVGDLTTESLQGALLRFCGRRGTPAEL